MSDTAPAQDSAPHAPAGRWFQKDGGSPLDRMPAFGEAMAKVAKAWTESFGALAASPGEIKLESLQICKVEEITARQGVASVLAVLQVPGWNTAIGVNFDRMFVATMVEALFGGGGDDIDTGETSPLSQVDMRIADVVVKQVAEALTAGFARLLPSPFDVDRIQVKLDLSFLGKPPTNIVVATLVLATLGSPVQIDVLIPLAALIVFADQLADTSEAAQIYEDPRWTQRLENEVGRAFMTLHACIDMDPITLGAIVGFRQGQVLPLPLGAGKKVRLTCGDDDLFRCDLGQSAGFYTLRIEEAIGTVEDISAPDQ
jgi:flagellar motor switch protein FliM